jgi:SSS family solute:Na+ symporter
VSWAAGIITFIIVKYVLTVSTATLVASPVLVSAILFIGMGWLNRNTIAPEVTKLLDSLSVDVNPQEH